MSALAFEFRVPGHERPSWAAPKPSIFSGTFAGLEIEERRKGRQGSLKKAEPLDPHREPSERLLEAWAPLENELREAIDPETFAIWLADLHPHRILRGVWYVACRPRARGWVEERYGRVIRACADRPVVFVACEERGQ